MAQTVYTLEPLSHRVCGVPAPHIVILCFIIKEAQRDIAAPESDVMLQSPCAPSLGWLPEHVGRPIGLGSPCCGTVCHTTRICCLSVLTDFSQQLTQHNLSFRLLSFIVLDLDNIFQEGMIHSLTHWISGFPPLKHFKFNTN